MAPRTDRFARAWHVVWAVAVAAVAGGLFLGERISFGAEFAALGAGAGAALAGAMLSTAGGAGRVLAILVWAAAAAAAAPQTRGF